MNKLLGFVSLASLLSACGDDTGTGGAGGSSDRTVSTATAGSTKTSGSTTTTGTTTTTTIATTTGMGGMPEGGGGAGQGGMADGGGGTGQGGGISGNGETCGEAIIAGEGTYVGTYNGFSNDYDPTDAGCTGYDEAGPDIAYRVTIPAGQELHAILGAADADGSVYLVTDCTMLGACLEGAHGLSTGLETLTYANNGATPLTAFVIVDSSAGLGIGDYTLDVSFGDETSCSDFFDNDLDDHADCADATSCQGTPACAPGAGPTGSPCAASTDCSATGGDPVCLPAPGFPGGYCSEWCDTSPNDCPGDAICLGTSFGDGLCMDGCIDDGDCRTGYYCPTYGYCLPLPTECVAPTALTLGATSGTTIGAPNDMHASCTVFFGSGAEEVYSFTPASSGTMTLTLASATDHTISLRTPSCAHEEDELQCVDSVGGGIDEILTEAVTAGTTYYIVVQPYADGNEADFTLTIAVN